MGTYLLSKYTIDDTTKMMHFLTYDKCNYYCFNFSIEQILKISIIQKIYTLFF